MDQPPEDTHPAPDKHSQTLSVILESFSGICRQHEGEVGAFRCKTHERLMENLFVSFHKESHCGTVRTVPSTAAPRHSHVTSPLAHCCLTLTKLPLAPPHLSGCCWCYLLHQSVLMTFLLPAQPSIFSPHLTLSEKKRPRA